jgi:hypothetical protein
MGMKVNGTSGLTFPDTTTLASAGQASVRAWVNFNGTGTVAIRAAYNVASITDDATGIYTLNFTTALPDADYAVVSMSSSLTGAAPVTMHQFRGTPATASSVKIYADVPGVGQVDSPNIYAAVFR